MDRRDFLKGVGVVGGIAGGLAGTLAALAGRAGAAGAGSGAAARSSGGAMLDLLDAVREVQAKYLGPQNGLTDPDDIAEGERALAHILETGLFFWLEANPERPVFKPYVTPTRKLLGDNPDSVYYFAPIRDDRSYRIRGNLGAATFTSFTIEGGSGEGHAARRSISSLADDEMEIDEDGGFEITISRTKPRQGNWLKLGPGAGQVTTRHYHESRQSVAAAGVHLPLRIEPLEAPALPPYGGESDVARRLGYVANFVREHAAISLARRSPEMAKQLGWISRTPNRFNKPGQWRSQSGENAYGNTHAWYNSGEYELELDEALVIEGRFPQCRFANVVLWNRFMQTYDFANRRVSLNRQQIDYETDGSYRIVVAHRDPGVPNWLDTEGRPRGQIYWRFVFPTEELQAPGTEVVKVSSLG